MKSLELREKEEKLVTEFGTNERATNPGCILEDFVRWHSPPDWTESDMTTDADETSDAGDLSSVRGQLSGSMQKEGNVWRELWETAKPVPAMRQSPLFYEDLAVYSTFLGW